MTEAMTVEAATLAERLTDLGNDMLHQARLATPDREEQIGALLGAAMRLIEQDVGFAGAAERLTVWCAPTMAAWASATPPGPAA